MLAAREQVVNTALTGEEFKNVLREGMERLLKAEGMLNSGAAFGRVAFTLALRIHTGNPSFPVTTTRVDSVPFADSPTPQVERPTSLKGQPNVSTHDSTLHRAVDSPNAERVALGMKVPVVVAQQDGSRKTEGIQYPVPADDPRTDPGHLLTEEEARAAGYNIIDVD